MARCDVACEAAPPASAASFQSSRGEREDEEEYELGSEEYESEYIDMDDEDEDEDDDDDGERRPSSFDMQGSWLETAEQARRAYRDDISARFERAGSRPSHVRGEPPSVHRHNSRRASTGAPDAASVMAIVSPRLASSSSSSSSAADTGPGTVVKSPYARFVAEARRSASVADILGAWESYKLERVLGESGQSPPPSSSARAGTAAAIAVHQVASMMRRNRERSVELEQMGRGHEMTELVAEALADIESCPAERVVRLVWSMSVMGGSYSFAAEDLESIISRKLFRNEKKGRYLLSRLRVEHLKDLAWSLGQFRYRDAEFMGAIMSCFEHKIDRANPRMCASVLWACAVTNVQPPASLLEKIVGRWDLDSWNSFSLCNSVWALAVLGLEGSAAFAALWNHMAGIAQSGQLDLLMGGAKNERAELLQIYQALIAIRGLDCEGDGTARIGGELKEMPHDIQRKAAMFWARYLRRKSQHISSFQRTCAAGRVSSMTLPRPDAAAIHVPAPMFVRVKHAIAAPLLQPLLIY